jgi:hypothetical protein
VGHPREDGSLPFGSTTRFFQTTELLNAKDFARHSSRL